MGRKRKLFASTDESSSKAKAEHAEVTVSNDDGEKIDNDVTKQIKDGKKSKRSKKKFNDILDNTDGETQHVEIGNDQLESAMQENHSGKRSKKNKKLLVPDHTNEGTLAEKVIVDTGNVEEISKQSKEKRSKRSKYEGEVVGESTGMEIDNEIQMSVKESKKSKKKKKHQEVDEGDKSFTGQLDNELPNQDDEKRLKRKKHRGKVVDEKPAEELCDVDNVIAVNEDHDLNLSKKKKKKHRSKAVEDNSNEEVNEAIEGEGTNKSKKTNKKIHGEPSCATEVNTNDDANRSNKRKRLGIIVHEECNRETSTDNDVESTSSSQDDVKRSKKSKNKMTFEEALVKGSVEEKVTVRRSSRKKRHNSDSQEVESQELHETNNHDKVQLIALPADQILVKPKRSKRNKNQVSFESQNEVKPDSGSHDTHQQVPDIVETNGKTKKKKTKLAKSSTISSETTLEQRISRHVHFDPNFPYNDNGVVASKESKEELVEENEDGKQTSQPEAKGGEELKEVALKTQESSCRPKRKVKMPSEPVQSRRSRRKVETNQELNPINELEAPEEQTKKREKKENEENILRPTRGKKKSEVDESKLVASSSLPKTKLRKKLDRVDSDDSLDGDFVVTSKKIEEKSPSDRQMDEFKKRQKKAQILREKMNQGPDIDDVIRQIDQCNPDMTFDLPPLMKMFENRVKYVEEEEELPEEPKCQVVKEKIVLEQPIIGIFKSIKDKDTSKTEPCYKLINDNYLKRLLKIITKKLAQPEFDRFCALLDLFQQVSESFLTSNEISQLINSNDINGEIKLFESCLYLFLSNESFSATVPVQPDPQLIDSDQLKFFLHPLLTFQFYLSRHRKTSWSIHSALNHFNEVIEEVECDSMHFFASFIFAFLKIFELRDRLEHRNDIIRLMQIFDLVMVKCKDHMCSDSSSELFLLAVHAILVFFSHTPISRAHKKPMESLIQFQAYRRWTESLLRSFFSNSQFDYIKEDLFTDFSGLIFRLFSEKKSQTTENLNRSLILTLSMLTHLVRVLPSSVSNYVPHLIFTGLKLIQRAGFSLDENPEKVEEERSGYFTLSDANEQIKSINWSRVNARVVFHLGSLIHTYVWYFDDYHPKLADLSQCFLESVQLDIESKYIFETLKRMVRA